MASSSRTVPLLRHATSSLASASPSPRLAVAQRAASTSAKPSSLAHQKPNVPSRTALPHYPLIIGPTQPNRLQEHYRHTLASDLLYMTYDHSLHAQPSSHPSVVPPATDATANPPSSEHNHRLRRWDPSDPYSKLRPVRPARGNRRLQPLTKPISSSETLRDLVRLEKVVLTCFSKDAIANKHALVPLIAQIRAITGLSVAGSHADPALLQAGKPGSSVSSTRGHIEIIRAKSGVASFKLRPGMPVGVKAVLPGPVGYDFLEILTTFVLPRLRSFGGFPLPPSSQPPLSPAALSGVVSLGMGPEAMALFPQIEINLDQYPGRGLGFQIDCITNQRGRKATEKARQLLSGLGVPFVRRGDL
ncbi:54S ribosomal protein L7, mitochondrial [Thecaphora frezii]